MRREAHEEYEALFRAAYASVLRSVFLVTRDRTRAEELCRAAFVRLHERWGTVRAGDHPDAWVRSLALRSAVDRPSRRDRVSRRPHADGATSPGPSAASGSPPPPDAELAEALGELTDVERAAVVLYYGGDRPVGDVARLLRLPTSVVTQHLVRARSRVAHRLGEEVAEDVR
jgi:RNA polymerase sigma factor (sigma-70 family)